MRFTFAFLLAVFSAVTTKAQTVIVRVYESPNYCVSAKHINAIVVCDGTNCKSTEFAACDLKKLEECESLKKIRETLDGFLNTGYKLLTSNSYSGNECTEITTYVLRKE
jgi:hypothetical protein